MRLKGLICIIWLVVLLAACGPQAAAPTVTPLATFTTESTATPIESPTPIETASPTEDVRTSLEYSANFVPVWYERSIGVSDGLEIPITIGLMEDVVNNSTYPIKEIHMTQEGAEQLPSSSYMLPGADIEI